MPDLTIIIPQFGRSELTMGCVRSVRRCAPAVPVLVVDDGSGPEHRAAVRWLACGGVRIVKQPHAGVTAAWNRGLAAVESEFVVFLNNDVVAGGPFLDALVQPLRDAGTLVAGARLRREAAPPREVLNRLPSEWFLEGWCLALRTNDLRRLGGFDERLRLYFSDTDMQARLLRAHGRGVDALAAVAALPLRHAAHQTTRGLPHRRRQWIADRDTFVRKWSGANVE
jgi:GT2 family glycosyltransferase